MEFCDRSDFKMTMQLVFILGFGVEELKIRTMK